jgi:hypothetical protein
MAVNRDRSGHYIKWLWLLTRKLYCCPSCAILKLTRCHFMTSAVCKYAVVLLSQAVY